MKDTEKQKFTEQEEQAGMWIYAQDHLSYKDAQSQAAKIFNVSPAMAKLACQAFERGRLTI
jgi:hypothetical protein